MRGRLNFIVAALAALMALLPVSAALAQPEPTPLPSDTDNDGGEAQEDPPPTFDGGVGQDGVLDVGQGSPSSGGSSPGPVTYAPTPRCRWVPANTRNTAGTAGADDAPVDGAQIENAAGELGWVRQCGAGEPDFVWLAPAIDPIDLVPSASARARAQLPLPTPDMSPTAETGSVVNLGVWFAIDDPGTTTARATLGSVWAQVQGTFQSVSVDPGDGSDPVTCNGFGTPYPEGSNDPDEGPCGHTYLERTPDDAPNQMTYTITYALTWSTSDGRSGSLGTYDRSATFDYDIDEIQTVGTG